MDNYLSHLNIQQRQAVEYDQGPQLVIAGAGSGKTRVLTYKIVHLLRKGYEPYQLLALTFTNKAAREMRERISALVGEEVASQLWMGTFHSIFLKILRFNVDKLEFNSNFTIYDTYDSTSLMKHIIKEMNLDDSVYKPAVVLGRISMMKNALYTPKAYAREKQFIEEDERLNRPKMAELYFQYFNRCKVANAMDFDDLLLYTNILFRDFPDVLCKYQNLFKMILIDEYQDTNFAQDNIVYQLARQHKAIFAVGDDAQSIYSFRGANIQNILSLERRYQGLKIFRLEQNYRSTQNITLAANSLIAKNSGQIQKTLFSENAIGSKVQIKEFQSDYDESYYIANTIVRMKQMGNYDWSDFAVLYRANSQTRILEKAFNSGGLKDSHGHIRMAIPYHIYGGLAFYQRKEVKDAVAYFRITLNVDDEEALLRIINYPKRGIGKTTVDKLLSAAHKAGVSTWKVLSSPSLYGVKLQKGTLTKLRNFKALIDGFIKLNSDCTNAELIVNHILEKTKLISVLLGDRTPENISRIENLNELSRSANDFVQNQLESFGGNTSLSDFMATVSLATDQDKEADSENSVTFTTVHSAKGLEFTNVIIYGVENDFSPSEKSQNSLQEIEEERRLLYVAITRAKQNCIITHARQHSIAGQLQPANPSPFLKDIDPKYVSQSSSLPHKWVKVDDEAISAEEVAKIHNPQATKASVSFSLVAPKPKMPSHQPQIATNPSNAKFSTHDISEISLQSQIIHKTHGKGVVIEIVDPKEQKVVVNFENIGKKTLILKFAQIIIL
ncbi:MAG: ATP-dependent helicase [Sodaliphilus sp.]